MTYLRERGLERGTLDAFGVGYAPAGGEVLVRRARSAGLAEEALFGSGLARKDERGRSYDFFRDRLVIPIRDLKGRTVGFGGRRLADGDPTVPKYVNTPETGVFHKGRLIYALDLALEHVRRNGHLILVEGYTDVMAAHQAGVRTVVAVLGTATTDEHALLVRRSGARRVSLVFDGDEAGRKATYKALTGLLGLDVAIDVVRIPGDEDPCDLLIREGRAPFDAALACAVPWFEFVLGALAELPPTQRSRGLDQALELVGRLPRALDRDAHLGELAARLGFPVAAVREQFETLPERARERARAAARTAAPETQAQAQRPAPERVDPHVRQAFGELVGAAILHAELAAGLAAWRDACPDTELRSLFDVVGALPAAEENDGVRVQALLTALADDPARGLVVPLLEHVERAENPREMYAGAQRYLERWQEQRRIDEGSKVLGGGDDIRILTELHQRLRRIKVPLTEPS
jgi:DNA primase